MRRILRKVAAGESRDLGDVTTLADPGVVDALLKTRPGAGIPRDPDPGRKARLLAAGHDVDPDRGERRGVPLDAGHGGAEGFERTIFEYSAIPQHVSASDVTRAHVRGRADRRGPAGQRDPAPTATTYDPDRVHARPTRRRAEYCYRGQSGRSARPGPPEDPRLGDLLDGDVHARGLGATCSGTCGSSTCSGASVEDTLGKLAYLVFYLVCGLGASAAQLAHDPDSIVPFLGASGAIAGVMGAFAVRFPGAQVLTLIPIILYTLAPPARPGSSCCIYIGEQVFMSLVHTPRERRRGLVGPHRGIRRRLLPRSAFSRSNAPGKACFRRRPADPFS